MLPLRYTFRNVLVRRASAVLTMLGIACTVAVFAGVIALRDGLLSVYHPRGDEDIAIYLRPGASSEGESWITRDIVDVVMKERPEIARAPDGRLLAAAESFLAVYMEQVAGGGLTNVPLRGIQPMSLELLGDSVRLVDGRWFAFGSDEVVIGVPLSGRMKNARIGDTLVLNLTPFRVVGIYEQDGVLGSEVWGDVDRMIDALDRPGYQRIVARLRPGTDLAAVQASLAADRRATVEVQSEREYMQGQTNVLGGVLQFLASFLTVIMGTSAVLGAVNTMLASVAARTHEIGVLLALGYSRLAIFFTFLFESALIGLLGGLAGVLLTLPFDGLGTGMTNFNTFTDVSFAFTVGPRLLLESFGLAFVLGLVGGVLPAWRAARLQPVQALRAH